MQTNTTNSTKNDNNKKQPIELISKLVLFLEEITHWHQV